MVHVQVSGGEAVYTSVFASTIRVEAVPDRRYGRWMKRFGAFHKFIRSVPVRGLDIEIKKGRDTGHIPRCTGTDIDVFGRHFRF